MIVAPLSNAENAFVDGTVWEMTGRPCIPGALPVTFRYTLDGVREIGGYEAAMMYEIGSDGNASFIAFVRTEGEKVYFALDEENPLWHICFDFGMKPGDEGYFYDMEMHPPYLHGRNLRCVSEIALADYGDYPAIELVELTDGKESRFVEVWFKGIGSTWGPAFSCRLGIVGGGMSLERVTNGTRVICEETPLAEPSPFSLINRLRTMRKSNPANVVPIPAMSGKTSKVLLR